MFQIGICDDKMQDLEIIQAGTEQWLEKNVGIQGSIDIFRHPEELEDCLVNHRKKFDLYMLDIMMSGIDGIQLGRIIRRTDTDVPIIYVTSAPEYALEAYGIHAIRYLMKPVDLNELNSALNLSYALFSMRPRHKMVINGTDSVTSIIMEEIMYIENNLRNMTYTLNDGRTVSSVRRSGSFENAVEPVASDTSFVQPHKSFFVNLKYVNALQSDGILMDDGRKIPIARRRLSEIQDRYIRFISKEGKK